MTFTRGVTWCLASALFMQLSEGASPQHTTCAKQDGEGCQADIMRKPRRAASQIQLDSARLEDSSKHFSPQSKTPTCDYLKMNAGTCPSGGWRFLSTISECEQAAGCLNLEDVSAESGNWPVSPAGCYMHLNELYFNTGGEHGFVHEDTTRIEICGKTNITIEEAAAAEAKLADTNAPVCAPDQSNRRRAGACHFSYCKQALNARRREWHAEIADTCKSTCAEEFGCKAPCQDFMTDCNTFMGCCKKWAENGDCENNPIYMAHNCKASCGLCHADLMQKPRRATDHIQ